VLTKGLKEKDREIEELKQHVSSLEDKLNDLYKIIKNQGQQPQQQQQETELHKEIIQEIIEE
jgi:predicted transcriptional regulator